MKILKRREGKVEHVEDDILAGISLPVVYVLNMVKNSDSRENGYWAVCLIRAGK
jgi:hypothetical protein